VQLPEKDVDKNARICEDDKEASLNIKEVMPFEIEPKKKMVSKTRCFIDQVEQNENITSSQKQRMEALILLHRL
jgi:hypothetical protein